MSHRIAWTTIALALLAGCAIDTNEERLDAITIATPPDDDKPGGVIGTAIRATPVEIVDEGELCLYGYEPPPAVWDGRTTKVEAGDDLVFAVTLPEPLVEGCHIQRQASCEVVLEDHQLLVEATFSYVEVEGEPCTRAFEELTAICTSPPLEEGTYEVVFDDQVAPLVVPSTGPACIIDTASPR